MKAGQQVKIAPKEVQQMNRLLSTNWLLATSDGKSVGLVPINYVRRLELSQMPVGETSDVTMEPVLIKDDLATAEEWNEENSRWNVNHSVFSQFSSKQISLFVGFSCAISSGINEKREKMKMNEEKPCFGWCLKCFFNKQIMKKIFRHSLF